MTNSIPNVDPNGYYELKAAASALNVDKSTLLRYTAAGYIRYSIKKCNKRKCWRGSDIITLWKSMI